MTIRLDAHLPEFHRGAPPQLPVRCATTANVTIATALNAGDTIDGVVLAAGDRVLVKNQTTGSQNGVYIAGATPARAFDMAEGVAAWGALVYVIAGTANGGKLFANTNATLPTIDTTALTWAEFASGGSALTIKDEGTPLTTAATSLDFVGAGVTATGSGAAKTITIPGAGAGGGPAAFVGAKVYNSAAQTVPSATATVLLWDSEELDSDGFHSTSSNTGRLTIPTGFDGKYLVLAVIEIGSSSTGERLLEIVKNGSTTVAYRLAIPPSAGLATIEAEVVLDLAAGDYVTAQATQTSGGSLLVSGPVQVSSFSIAQLAVGGASGAPTTADYLVGTAQAGLSAEIVVGTTPGGELGGTWASPTVDGTHSGSAHTDFVAKSVLTTQDDIFVRDATGPARLGKGSDGQVLTVDPTTHHLVWATPASGGTIAAKEDGTTVVAAATSLNFTTGLDVSNPGGGVAGVAVDASEIPLDTLGTPSDITTLNASTSRHGLLRKLTGSTSDFLRADGAFADPGAGGGTGFNESVYGPGSDGDVTIGAGTTTLGRDMYYNNLTVNGTLVTNGWRVFVKGTLSGSGTIDNTPAAAPNNAGTGTGSAGGAAGTLGATTGSNNTGRGAQGITGRVGGFNGAGLAGTGGQQSTAARADATGVNHPIGSAGGAGANAGGAGAAATNGVNTLEPKPVAYPLVVTSSFNSDPFSGRPSGAGSGGGSAAGGGGGSGATGNGGGPIILVAKTWSGTFNVTSLGSRGGNGGNGFAGSGSNGGGAGGNGGPGGVIVAIYNDRSGWSGALDVSGGAGGTHGNGAGGGANGADGSTGPSGHTFLYRVS